MWLSLGLFTAFHCHQPALVKPIGADKITLHPIQLSTFQSFSSLFRHPSRICLTFMHFSGPRLAFSDLHRVALNQGCSHIGFTSATKPVLASTTRLNHHRPSNGGNCILCAIHSPFLFSSSDSILTSLLFIASLSIPAGLIRAVR